MAALEWGVDDYGKVANAVSLLTYKICNICIYIYVYCISYTPIMYSTVNFPLIRENFKLAFIFFSLSKISIYVQFPSLFLQMYKYFDKNALLTVEAPAMVGSCCQFQAI